MWLRTGQLANRVQDIALAYRCAVIMPEGGSIWELYHGCYLGYKPNQDINKTDGVYRAQRSSKSHRNCQNSIRYVYISIILCMSMMYFQRQTLNLPILGSMCVQLANDTRDTCI